jgi:hypothetical protein
MKSKSRKGKVSGSERKRINGVRSDEALDISFMSEAERARKGKVLDFVFGRVTKITGANHVRVAIATKKAPYQREVLARIPNIFTRRGSTPITTSHVVTVYTGAEFDPDEKSEGGLEHYDVTSVLTPRQANELKKAGAIPEWMLTMEGGASTAGKEADLGFEWGESDSEPEEDAADASAGGKKREKDKKRGGGGGAAAGADSDFDIDDI